MQWLIIFVIVCLIGSMISDVRWLIVFGITCLISSMYLIEEKKENNVIKVFVQYVERNGYYMM